MQKSKSFSGRRWSSLALAILSLMASGCKKQHNSSTKILNGSIDYSNLTATILIMEIFPDHVEPRTNQVVTGTSLICSGTMVTTTLLITAAHCLNKDYKKIVGSLDGVLFSTATKWEYDEKFSDSANLSEKLAHDVGFVTFAAGSIPGATVTKLAAKSIKVDDVIKLVGYGRDQVATNRDGSVSQFNPGERHSGINSVYSIASDPSRAIGYLKANWDQSASALRGDSGGALYNAAEELVGVISRSTVDSYGETLYNVNIHSPVVAAYIQRFVPDFKSSIDPPTP